MTEFKLPTEVIDLPSKGLLYPKDNPLATGKIEIKYMTAKEEDILSNSSYIRQGIVLDKLFQSDGGCQSGILALIVEKAILSL